MLCRIFSQSFTISKRQRERRKLGQQKEQNMTEGVGSTRVYIAESEVGYVEVIGSRELNYFFSGIPDSMCVQATMRGVILQHDGSSKAKSLGSPVQMLRSEYTMAKMQEIIDQSTGGKEKRMVSELQRVSTWYRKNGMSRLHNKMKAWMGRQIFYTVVHDKSGQVVKVEFTVCDLDSIEQPLQFFHQQNQAIESEIFAKVVREPLQKMKAEGVGREERKQRVVPLLEKVQQEIQTAKTEQAITNVETVREYLRRYQDRKCWKFTNTLTLNTDTLRRKTMQEHFVGFFRRRYKAQGFK